MPNPITQRWHNYSPQALHAATRPRSTVGHTTRALAEDLLRAALNRPTHAPQTCHDRATETQLKTYLEFVSNQIAAQENPRVLIGQDLDFCHLIPGGFGTADCVILTQSSLHVIILADETDTPPEAQNNLQLMLYALSALDLFDQPRSITEVSMSIHQPRHASYSTWTIRATKLHWWARTVLTPAVAICQQGDPQ